MVKNIFSSSVPWLNRLDFCILAQILANLSLGLPERLVCRDKELDKLKAELSKLLDANKSGSFYVSGLPGTGKTASLKFTLTELKASLISFVYKAYVLV